MCLAAAIGLTACSEEPAGTGPGNLKGPEAEETGFTLTATYGSPDTKVAFDEDGLNLSWQPGDCLYLIDVTGRNSTTAMSTTITSPSKTAKFKSASSVLSGDYIVLYGQNTLDIYKTISMTTRDQLKDQIRLYGTLHIEDGMTDASITLSHLYSMLTFKFRNLPSLSDMKLGMAVSKDGIPELTSGKVSAEGFAWNYYTYSSKMVLFDWNRGEEGKTLIPPVDFSGKKVYFFIYGKASDGKYVNYEFVKNGKALRAGVNNNLTFDCAAASSVCTLEKSTLVDGAWVLTTPLEFRTAALMNYGGLYSVEADVDFSGETYFPIRASCLFGHNHTLSNLHIDLGNCSNVGVLSEGAVQELTVRNSSIIGYSYVGTFSGYNGSGDYSITDCCAEGVTVQGNNSVGGIVGGFSGQNSRAQMLNCSVTGVSTITASGDGDYGGQTVGGIAGSASYISEGDFSNCLVKGQISVSGTRSVGGIVGNAQGRIISECGFEGVVSGEKYVGGIAGSGKVHRSYVKGDVSGTDSSVGGVSGTDECIDCYHIGNTTSTNVYIGGIAGYGASSTQNCYSYGTTSSDYGIGYNVRSTANLTSSPRLSSYSSLSDNCNCGPEKTFLSRLSVINGNEAYSTQVWKGIDAQCPILQWQAEMLNGSIVIPGFGDEDW